MTAQLLNGIMKHAKGQFKRALYGQFAQIGKALASSWRIEMIELLAQAERTVEQISRELDIPVSNASQHLQVLRRARLVEVTRDGLYARYRIADESVFRLWRTMRDLGEKRLAEIERILATYLEERDSLEAVSIEELQRRLRDGSVQVLDVRPAAEYESGHIAGALSFPIAGLKANLRKIPRNRDIVVYCRGPYCILSDEAVRLLKGAGFRSRRLVVGFPDWRERGLPVAIGRHASARAGEG